MIKTAGKNPKTTVYLYNGYSYSLDKRGQSSTYRCVKRNSNRCTGKIYVVDGRLKGTTHNHNPEVQKVEKQAMVDRIIQRCKDDIMLDPKQVFDELCAENPTVGGYLSFKNIKKNISKQRLLLRPVLPDTLEELDDVLKNYEPLQGYYQNMIKTADTCGLVFAKTDTFRKVFEETDRLLIVKTDIAGIFFLTEKLTLELYESLWSFLIQHVPTTKLKVTSTISDYGMTVMSGIRSRFPHARVHGCWFYYRQALLRKWKEFQIECAESLLWMAISLPLAPASAFEQGLAILQSTANAEPEGPKNFTQFLSYLQDIWAPHAEKIGFHAGVMKSNDAMESFHKNMNNVLGGVHPDFWAFFRKLTTIMDNHESDLENLKKGEDVKRPTPQQYRSRNNSIKEHQKSLASGRKLLREFLQAFHRYHETDTFDERCNDDPQIASSTDEGVDGSLFVQVPDNDDDHHRKCFAIYEEMERESEEEESSKDISTHENDVADSANSTTTIDNDRAVSLNSSCNEDSNSEDSPNLAPTRAPSSRHRRRPTRFRSTPRNSINSGSPAHVEPSTAPVNQTRGRGGDRNRGLSRERRGTSGRGRVRGSAGSSGGRAHGGGSSSGRGRARESGGSSGRGIARGSGSSSGRGRARGSDGNSGRGRARGSDGNSGRGRARGSDGNSGRSRARGSDGNSGRGRARGSNGSRNQNSPLAAATITGDEADNDGGQARAEFSATSSDAVNDSDISESFRDMSLENTDYDTPSDDYGVDTPDESPKPYLSVTALQGENQKELAKHVDRMCVACRDEIASMIFTKCGHMCLCSGCITKYKDNRCPMCRKASKTINVKYT